MEISGTKGLKKVRPSVHFGLVIGKMAYWLTVTK